jgi:AcrR family transcriptional regulator
MRLFGEKGYAATSVAQIEAAAGLSPGSGSLYKHFRSKEELLDAGLDRLLSTTSQAIPPPADAPDPAALVEQLQVLVRAGLARLEQDRDLNRLLFRGLGDFPVLMRRFGEQEIARVHAATTAVLGKLAGTGADEQDWAAVALTLQGAVAHYWVLTDLFGEHPTGVDEERFVAAVAAVGVALLRSSSPDEQTGTSAQNAV